MGGHAQAPGAGDGTVLATRKPDAMGLVAQASTATGLTGLADSAGSANEGRMLAMAA
jgi:hypothetical protein